MLKIKNIIQKQDILLYIVSFMVSMVSFNGNLAPFGLAIFAACCSNRKPVGLIYILSLIGTAIGFGLGGLSSYLISSILLIILIVIIRPNYEEDRNEKQKLGLYVFIASFLVQAFKMFFTGFLIYDLITSITLGLITYIFYKIFVNSILVITQESYRDNNAYSVEEVIGASLLLCVALVSLANLKVLGLSVTNILCVMLVLYLGWRHGVLIGATSGVTIGMTLGIIASSSPILIAAYAISGMLAGLLNRFGKIGVIVGFCIGNAILTYVANGNTVPIITIREILIASLGLLIIPERAKINIEDVIPQVKCFPVTSGVLEGETSQKLNTVSETIKDMAKSCQDSAKDVLDKKDIEEENKELFIDDLFTNFEDIEENIFYDDLIDNEQISYDIYENIVKSNEITKQELVKILEKNTDSKIEQNEEVKKNLDDIVRLVNATYRIHKLNILWKVKEATHKKVLATQLNGVSKVISDLADNIADNISIENSKIDSENNKIESKKSDKNNINNNNNNNNKSKKSDKKKDELKEKFYIKKIVLTKTKEKNEISGDNNLMQELDDGKYLIALSDGMGSGEKANKSSTTVIKMLKKLLCNGFDKETSISLINSSINLNSNEETYATIDLSIIDLTKGNVEFVKNGACPTFIKSKNNVEIVKAVSFPAGMLDNIDLVVYDKDIKENDIIVMCSDGILESNKEYKNKEIWLKNLLENIETDDIEKIANIIMTEAVDNGLGIVKDDMTVIVTKLQKK